MLTSIISREKIEKSKLLQKFVRSKHTFFFNKDKIGNDGLPSHVRAQGGRETGLNEIMLARYLAHSCVHSEYKINTHHIMK